MSNEELNEADFWLGDPGKLAEALKDAKDEEIINFREWCKRQAEIAGPLSVLSYNNPDMVAYQFYETSHLEDMGFDSDKWRAIRAQCDVDTVTIEARDEVFYDAMNIMESFEEDDDYEEDEED